MAFTPNSPGAGGVQKGYPLLLRQFDVLKNRGVNINSAVSIFDDVQETLYIDNCCHFNELGHKILSDFIAQAILDSEIFEGKAENPSLH